MSRKRRRSCRGRKSSDTRENEHIPTICQCQQNTHVENRTGEEEASDPHIHEAMNVIQPDKNRNNRSCTEKSGRKYDGDDLENKEQDIMCDSVKEGEQEKNCSLLGFLAQQEDVLAVANMDESGTTSAVNITQECSFDDADSLQSDKAFIVEVKCGSFTIKLEMKKDSLFDTGMDCVARRWKSPKERRCHRDHCCKQPKESGPSAGHSGKYRTPKYTLQIANNQNASMKVSIIEKETEVKYVSGKQKLMVSIEPCNKPKKGDSVRPSKYGNTFASDADYSGTEECCHSDSESDFSLPEEEDRFTQYTCSEWGTVIPPPAEFADSEEAFLDCNTEVVSLRPTGDMETFQVALNCGDGGDFFQEKDNKKMECSNEKDFYEDIIFSEFSYTGTSPQEDYSSREIHFGSKPNDEMSDVQQGSNNSLVETKNITPVSHMESNNVRRYSFPATSIDILSSFHPRRDSGFYSMPSLSLKVLPKPSKVTNIYNNSTLTPISCTELSSSLTSLLGNLRDLKSSCCYAFTSYDHDMTLYHAELEGKLSNAFFIDHCFQYMEDCRETEEMAAENFHSVVNSRGGQTEEHRPTRFLRRSDVHEEYPDQAKSELDCEAVRSDHHEVQVDEEFKNKGSFSQASSLFRSPTSNYNDQNNISPQDETEGIQDEHIELQPTGNLHLSLAESEETKKKRRGSVMTVITGELERRLIIRGDKSMADSFSLAIKKEPILPCSIREMFMSPLLDVEEPDLDNEFQSLPEVQEMPDVIHEDSTYQEHSFQADGVSCLLDDEHLSAGTSFTKVSDMLSSDQDICSSDSYGTHLAAEQTQELAKPSYENPEVLSEINMGPNPDTTSPKHQTDNTATTLEDVRVILSNEQESKDVKLGDYPQEEAIDRWAIRRKQFKNSKRCSSAGGSSINSTLTEGSINSEDGRSFDLGLHGDNEERNFYTEIFHSTSWVFRGDDASPNNSPRCLSKRPRPVAVRERTVRIAKGTGDYPWGFRIQFSKPILVTEVDTNSAAEEAGLQIGDIVMAVNGTDVTSMPHSEAANLARKGPDILTLLVGSDISRCPNTPRPTCRGYLHKRTQSGILRGWRKRWFVLKHDGCLYYYKHKKDEGKCRPLEVTKLEGAEIGVDSSLGKTFVFKCIPQTGNRTFYFCATSNQEMKRWLEAMEKAVHPVHQNHVWVDVTLHNTSLPPLAIKNPECLGLLHELDKNKDTWNQHYCILKDGCLYFYASIRSTHALGGIYLQGYTVSEQALGSRRSVIEAKPPSEEFKTFYLCAESVNENKRWITALRASISKWLPLNKAIQDFMNRPLEETRM
uniref:Pleckstrin homology domain-containing family A member 5 n=1 Tax=Pogona vitticeps TaxID=103695 RepID=A0A6J0TR76_9SAUR